jgi:hypothetical protein
VEEVEETTVLSRNGFNPEDGDNKLLRNVGIYRRVYPAPKSRRTRSSSARLHGAIFHRTVIFILAAVRT